MNLVAVGQWLLARRRCNPWGRSPRRDHADECEVEPRGVKKASDRDGCEARLSIDLREIYGFVPGTLGAALLNWGGPIRCLDFR
jgi:hypothetical protein